MLNNLLKNFEDVDFEKLMEMANAFLEHKDDILDLVKNIPEILHDTGETIASAGDSAVNASAFLMGGNKVKKGASAKDISILAADALDRCYKELDQVSKFMQDISEDLDKINLPTIKPIFDKAAGRIHDGSSRLSTIGGDLENVAGLLRDLGGNLSDTGQDLNSLGEKLKKGGTALQKAGNWKK